jgi:hypothetical protein
LRLRTPLLLLVGALAGAVVPSTAFAAVPNTKPKYTLDCIDGGGQARLWTRVTNGRLTKLAVDNPCKDHFALTWGSPTSGALLVAPGTHFNWSQKRIRQHNVQVHSSYFWEQEPICMGSATVRVVRRYNRVLTMQEAFGLEC